MSSNTTDTTHRNTSTDAFSSGRHRWRKLVVALTVLACIAIGSVALYAISLIIGAVILLILSALLAYIILLAFSSKSLWLSGTGGKINIPNNSRQKS